MPTSTVPPPLPVHRDDPLHPPAEYAELRAGEPVSRRRWPNGIDAWLVSGYEQVRQVLGDPRTSVDRASSPPPSLGGGRRPAVMLPKSLVGMDPPEHTRWRELVIRELTVAKIRALQPRVERIVDEHLDRLAAAGPPADLVSDFSLPVPSLVICELLGVPAADRPLFTGQVAVRGRVSSTPDEVDRATIELTDYIRTLVAAKRAAPTPDLLSRLTGAQMDGRAVPDEELVSTAFLLLVAGHDTTANMIALSVVTLLSNPGLIPAILDPTQAHAAAEELLRFHSVIQYGVVRRATADMSLGGHHIGAGDWLVCSLASANRDEAAFAEPDLLRLDRPARAQMSFGDGPHQCAGQNLARMELTVALSRLFRRFPGLALQQPLDRLPFRADMFVYGLHELPVRW
jgi:cytochrome P450